jgi:hypothetical protein
MCVDNDDCRCQHWNTWAKSLIQDYIDYEFRKFLNDHKDVFNVFTIYTQLSRLLEYAIECGQHIQANKERQQTLWSSTQKDINELPFMIHSTQDFYNKSIIILKFFHMDAYIPYLSLMLYNYKTWFLKKKKKGKQVELVIISFVHFFRELNSQLVSAKWFYPCHKILIID